jgi:hypothetical protein
MPQLFDSESLPLSNYETDVDRLLFETKMGQGLLKLLGGGTLGLVGLALVEESPLAAGAALSIGTLYAIKGLNQAVRMAEAEDRSFLYQNNQPGHQE